MGGTCGIHDRAAGNHVLRREEMERAGGGTADPGWGGLVPGLTLLAAAILGPAQPAANGWLAASLIATCDGRIAVLIKARRTGVAFFSRPARKEERRGAFAAFRQRERRYGSVTTTGQRSRDATIGTAG